MANSEADNVDDDRPDGPVRRRRLRRILAWILLGLLVLIVIAAAVFWIFREPIARGFIERELERRGVQGTYEIERFSLRTQELSNVVIGDPDNPDLTAERIRLQTRLQLDGTLDVYRIVARGVRLRGKVLPSGRVSWGEIDKLLPPPGDQPFTLPDVTVDVADSTISLSTPWGPIGFAIRGSGNLTGGFEGRFVIASPRLVTGTCFANTVRGAGMIEIEARHPEITGPLTADRFACPPSDFSVVEPRLEIESRFAEGFDSFSARARIISQRLMAGPNGLAALNGVVTFEGTPTQVTGDIDLTAREARLATVFSETTEVAGDYRLDVTKGILVMDGRFEAEDANIARQSLAGAVAALEGLSGTPVGPITTQIATAIRRSAGSFDARGEIALFNAPAGGRFRVQDTVVEAATGARATISDGNGITYSWPTGGLGFEGRLRVAGGGLPTGAVMVQRGPGGQVRGRAEFEPMSAGGARLALAPVEFQSTPGGETRFATVAELTGPISGGMVRGLRVPIRGRIGPSGGFQVGQSCTTISFDALRLQEVRLGPARFPVCPAGPAIIYQRPGGELQIAARLDTPRLSGSIGGAELAVRADQLVFSGTKDFRAIDVVARLGDPDSPVVVTAERLAGSFTGPGIGGTVSGGTAVIADIPLLMTEIDGDWQLRGGELTIDGGLLLSDRADPPRFYPLRSDDVHFVLADNLITTTGTLRHPYSGTLVTNVVIEHSLDTGAGHANLDVPGITFGEALQPEELTRLTEGVIALVQGTVHGQGRIEWAASGEVTSTGDISTRDLDFAAAFGPVEGLTTSIHFTDLLGLVSAPGQVAQIDRVNPGIVVENGIIEYQLLPDQLVKIERGEWPFMGGRLILHETILNFGRPTPKRLTFEIVGLDAKVFVDSLGFAGLEATGTFDGVLPMIFDEEGGRVVGGRLDSRPPGGTLEYTGTLQEADLGMMGNIAFNILRSTTYRKMVIRLDGYLAGEFATRITIDRFGLGSESVLLAPFRNVPFRFNINITGPFRALIQMARGFKDPRPVIAPVMPFPLDAPGIVTEVRSVRKEQEETQTEPQEEIEVSPEPPLTSE